MTKAERWQTLTLDLKEPLRELCCEAGYDGVRALFLWDGLPLGHARFPAAQSPVSPSCLARAAARAVATPAGDRLLEEGFRPVLPGLPDPVLRKPVQTVGRLSALEKPLERICVTQGGSGPTVSVAVCTRERPAELRRCLKSLLASAEPPEEILVIDNAPQSATTREALKEFTGVLYYSEPRSGLSAARNRALSVARGDVVAFADDDVVVDRHWVKHLRRSFLDPKVMLVTGLVLPAELETPAQVMFEEYFQFFHQGYRTRRFDAEYFMAMRERGVPVWEIGAGANMAVRRRAFDLGYRFDTRLGPGVFGGCGEDSEFWYRLLAGGWTCLYEPTAFVYHYHRRDLEALRRQVRQYMQGHVAALLLQFARYRHRGNLKRLFFELPMEYFLLALRLVVTGFSLENRILLGGALGCLAGLGFIFRLFPRSAPAQTSP
jgi:cellulose synthase/poly-beta-1,6-N-acetylglucosamine synthase-like glycosyltransferase